MSNKNFASFGDLEAILPSYAQDIKGRLKKVIAMPSNPSDKETVLFTGTTTSQYKKGGIYEYAEGAEMPLFAWTESTTTVFTEIETPSAGDSVYDSQGAEIGTIESVDTGKVAVDTTEYSRNTESDTTITVGRGWNLISTSDLTAGDGIIIDGEVISSDSPIFYETEDNHWEDLTDEQKSHYKYVVNDKDGTTYLVAREVTRAGISPVDSQAIFLFALQKVTEMPQSPVLNDFVLYIGADTYTYNAVTPEGTENPQELGWYESDGTDYTLSTDTTVTTGKTYYVREKALIQGGIYRYNGTTWELKSATGDIEITIDSELSDTSHNAVENQAITNGINQRLLVSDTMPTPSVDYLGQTRLYIGSTTTNYQEGGIYKCESDGQTPPTYSWNIKNKADIDLSLYKKIFTGTQATWNTLTDTQKKEYDIANITDDTEDSVVDEVADGDMRAVTSNAVYNATKTTRTNLVSLVTLGEKVKQQGALFAYKTGRLCSVTINLLIATADISSGEVLFTLPVGFRQGSGGSSFGILRNPDVTSSENRDLHVSINPQGTITTIYDIPSGNRMQGSLTFFTD